MALTLFFDCLATNVRIVRNINRKMSFFSKHKDGSMKRVMRDDTVPKQVFPVGVRKLMNIKLWTV